MTEHTNITIRYLLTEADDSLRALERAYKSTGSEEEAVAYVKAAKRANLTNSPTYYGALWAMGARPTDGAIHRPALAISEAHDQLIVAYSREHRVDQLQALDDMTNITRPRGVWGNVRSLGRDFRSNLDRILWSPGKASRQHIKEIITYIARVVDNFKKLELPHSNARFLKKSLDSFKALDGQE